MRSTEVTARSMQTSNIISVLKYGEGLELELELPAEAVVADLSAPRGTPLADVRSAVRAALESPLDFPPLRKAIVPGDKVVLPLAGGLPQAAAIVAGIADVLLEGGIEPSDITVLCGETDTACNTLDPRSRLPADLAKRVNLVVHDPADRQKLAYLTVTTGGTEVLLNRAICDADLVLPVGCLRPRHSSGYHGVHGGLFPTFADTPTKARYRQLEAAGSAAEAKNAQRDIDEVGWLVGGQLIVQVLPGPAGSVLEVLAGESRTVANRGRQLSEATWSYTLPRAASLVVAAVDGGAAEQTWENFGRALMAAGNLVEEGGAIVLCTQLDAPLGKALKSTSGRDGDERFGALKRLRKHPPSDYLPAMQLARALERSRVYLLSRLDEGLVEDLGMAAVTSGDQVARLTRHQPSCILLGSAQHVAASVREQA